MLTHCSTSFNVLCFLSLVELVSVEGYLFVHRPEMECTHSVQ